MSYFSKFENGPQICGFWGVKRENIKNGCRDPLGNKSLLEHVIQCKKYGDTPKNVFSRAWQEKYKKDEEKKNPLLNVIFHPFATLTLLGRFVPFLAGRVTWPT